MSARFDYFRGGEWDDLSAGALNLFRKNGFQQLNCSAQVYLGISHALVEITSSLQRLYVNRKTVVIETGVSPHFAKFATWLGAQGLNVVYIPSQKISASPEWLKPISKDVLLVVAAVDHPIFDTTPQAQAINDELAQQRIFFARIAHATQAAFESNGISTIHSTELVLFSLRRDLCFALCGERFKWRPQECDMIHWPANLLENVDFQFQGEDKDRILAFEANLPNGWKTLDRPADTRRVYHRSVIYHEGIEGSALLEILRSDLGLKAELPGHGQLIETASLLWWRDSRLDDWLAEIGLAPRVRRGLIFLDQSLLNAELPGALDRSTQKLLSMQSGGSGK